MRRPVVASLAALCLVVAAAGVTQATFLSTASQLATGNGRSYLPTLHAGPKGTFFLAWTDGRREKFDLYLSRSRDGGRTWSQELRIDGAKPLAEESAGAVFAQGKRGSLHAVWFSTRNEQDVGVMHAASRDQGTTWSPPRQLSRSPGAAFEPQIAGDGAGRLYVTWYERRDMSLPKEVVAGFKVPGAQTYDVYFTSSDDEGGSWQTPIRINPRDDSPMAITPQIAYGGQGHVYVLWQEREAGRSLGVYVAASPDHGKTWPTRGVKLDRGHVGVGAARLAADRSGHVYAAWNDGREAAQAVYFNTSADHARTWAGDDVRLGKAPPGKAHSSPPRLTVGAAGRVFVT